LPALPAKKYQRTAPKPVAGVAEAIPEGLTIFAFPDQHRRRLRTLNFRERRTQEIARRTHLAGSDRSSPGIAFIITAARPFLAPVFTSRRSASRQRLAALPVPRRRESRRGL
jgi:hypothetical protein